MSAVETWAQVAAAVGTLGAAWYARSAARRSADAVEEMKADRQSQLTAYRVARFAEVHELLSTAISQAKSPPGHQARLRLEIAEELVGRSLPVLREALLRGFGEGRDSQALEEVEAGLREIGRTGVGRRSD